MMQRQGFRSMDTRQKQLCHPEQRGTQPQIIKLTPLKETSSGLLQHHLVNIQQRTDLLRNRTVQLNRSVTDLAVGG